MQTSDYLHVLFVSGSVIVIYTFSVTGHIRSNKPKNIIKLGFNWSSFRTSGVVLFFVVMACIRATSVDIIEILPISLNSFSCKIHLLRYDLIEIRNTILLQLLY